MDRGRKRKLWKKHLHKIDFPRDVGVDIVRKPGMFMRKEVQNYQRYIRTIERFKTNHLYTSIYSRNQHDDSRYDKIFIDIDGGIEDSYETMQGIVHDVEYLYGITPNVYCSGSGGYHVFLYFPQTEVKTVMTLRKFTLALVQEAKKNIDESVNTDFVDTSVLGDSRRVSRIPLTINHKTGKFCTPVNPEWDLSKIKSEINRPKDIHFHVEECKRISMELREIDRSMMTKEERTLSKAGRTGSEPKYEDELVHLLDNAGSITDGRKRLLSFVIIPRLIHIGRDKSEVKEYCKRFLNQSGKSFMQYETLIEKMYERTLRGPPDSNEAWRPWSIYTFSERYSDLDILVG